MIGRDVREGFGQLIAKFALVDEAVLTQRFLNCFDYLLWCIALGIRSPSRMKIDDTVTVLVDHIRSLSPIDDHLRWWCLPILAAFFLILIYRFYEYTDEGVKIASGHCIFCKKREEACPKNAIYLNLERKSIIRDLCGGSPKCVEWCPKGVISYKEEAA